MNEQIDTPQDRKISLRDLPGGFKMIIISALFYVITLFFNWVVQRGFLGFYHTGFSFMDIMISHSSGLPFFFLVTLISAILCVLLCIPFFKLANIEKKKGIPIFLIILSIIGLSPYFFLPFELREWSPPGQFLFGGWLSFLCVIGLVIGSIKSLSQVNAILFSKKLEIESTKGK